MSSARKATTPAARRNPPRAAKAPWGTTGAPSRARNNPHGDRAGGSQADAYEAAHLSDHGTSDGDMSGAEADQLAANCTMHPLSSPASRSAAAYLWPMLATCPKPCSSAVAAAPAGSAHCVLSAGARWNFAHFLSCCGPCRSTHRK